MPRRPLATTLTALLAALLLTPSAASAADDGVPQPVPLTQGWQKIADPAAVGVAEGLWRVGNRAAWQPTVVPAAFTGQTPAAAYPGTVGWYRTTFRAPAATPGFSWMLHFEQVRRSAQVWLNGTRIGRHDDPFVPFDIDVATVIRPGADNTLVVRADNRKAKDPREGWWNWGGITRPVSLIPRGTLLLRDAGVLSDVDCPDGGGECTTNAIFDGVLENRGTQTVRGGQVTVRIGTRTATVAARPLAPGEQTHLRQVIRVPGARLWSPESPELYDVRVTTTAGDAVQQVDRWKTGFREVKVVGGMLTLNGRQLNLHGASIQEDVPGKGPAIDDADIAKIVSDLKEVNANVTRAHYLLHPRLLDALDAAGIMVWSQAPVYHRDVLLKDAQERRLALQTVRETIVEARNHPSVITHSVANELSAVPDENPGTRAFLGAARRVARDTDPTIPASVDLLSYPGYPRQSAYAQYELLGINSYFGWYRGKRNHSVKRLQDLGPFLDRTRRQYPSQGLVVTEFGAESTFDGPDDEKESYGFQTGYLRDVMDIVAERPFVGGAIYWTLREFAVKPEWDGGAERDVPRDAIHNKGLIAYDGTKKPAWTVARQRFGDAPLYRNVSPAAAAGVPGAIDGGTFVSTGVLLALGICALLLALLALDGWVTAGILRRGPDRRRTRPGPASSRAARPGSDGTAEPAGARAV